MFEPYLIGLIPLLPALAGLVIFLFGPKVLKEASHWPLILASAASLFIALSGSYSLSQLGHEASFSHHAGIWFATGGTHPVVAGWDFRFDPISGMMTPMVCFLGLVIAMFSAGYMHGDPGYARYFGVFSLFVASMNLLLLADNLILLYAGWEGVGVCSYLLVGFWFAKPSAAKAARKAFLVTRIGDVGLLLGIFLLWAGCDFQLDLHTVLEKARQLPEDYIYFAGMLLFIGAMGKSAQFPLHVWLPDAMEGPTPVSALIHAATMVTAGVYLVARFLPVFSRSSSLLAFIAAIGCITALLAALIALTQNDLKRILAYSTISQLGYMFMGLGSADGAASQSELVTVAMTAGMFHLFTHAFFKALLFLSAGSIMHAMHHVIDIRKLGGLRHVLPWTHIGFLAGAVALAGLFPFSGFWSKEEILKSLDLAAHRTEGHPDAFKVMTWLALITSGLTAFYTFRAYFRVFWGEEVIPEEAHGHAHESPTSMVSQLLVLTPLALGIGWYFGYSHLLEHYLAKTHGFAHIETEIASKSWIAITSQVLAVAGIALAYVVYIAKPALDGLMRKASGPFYKLSLNRFYLDELFTIVLVRPFQILSWLIHVLDRELWDRLVDSVARLPAWLGDRVRPVQNGLIQFYALAMALGLTIFLVFLAFGDRLYR